MGLRSLVAQYFGGPIGAQLVASHDEKYADTGAENPYIEQIINQSNHSGVTKWGSAVAGGIGGEGGVDGSGESTGSDLGDKAASAGGKSIMSRIGGGVKGTANHKDMFNQPVGEDGSMGAAPWTKDGAISDIVGGKAQSDQSQVNLFRGGGAGADMGNRLVNAALPDSWKENIAPWTPQNIYGTVMSKASSGLRNLFGSNGASAENEEGDVDLD